MTKLETLGRRLPVIVSHRWWRFFVILACFVPPALVIAKIVNDGVNVPFMDQWDTSYKIALNTLDGTLTFDNIIAFHNEHRILFTNLLTVFTAQFLQWNLYLELFVTVVLAFILLGLVVWLVRRDFPQVTLAALIPVSALVFSLRGGHTWMTSFQNCFLWVTLFFLLGLGVLRRWKTGWLPLVLAAGCAFASTFSLASGILTWAVLGIGLPLFGYRKVRYWLFWVAAAAVCFILFFAPPRPATQIGITLAKLPHLLQFTLAYLGSPFVAVSTGGEEMMASVPIAVVGVVLLFANAAYLWWRRQSWERLTVWILIGGYAAGTALLTGLGRGSLLDGFPFQALAERYVIIAVFWWVSLIVLGLASIYTMRQRGLNRSPDKLLFIINLLVFAAAVVLFSRASLENEWNVRTVSPDSEKCYGQYVITQDDTLTCLPRVRMDFPEAWLPRLNTLSMRRLAMFNTQQLNISLYELPYSVLDLIYGAPEPHYETFAGASTPALFEHPNALIEYALSLPDWYAGAEFAASLYLDPSNVLKDPDRQQDGVIFSAIAIGEDGQTRRSEAVVFDPHVNTEPVPFAFDLSDFVGQRVRLQLQTEGRETLDYDWALWVDPVIRLSD